jgi:ADP-ribosylation factor protein 1
MGLSLTKISSYFSKHNQARILVCGLDAAGKTTILYISRLGEVETVIPTIGFNVETLTYGNLKITAWDVGGREKIRALWRHYYLETAGLVFVVDSNDRDRISEATEELYKMTKDEDLQNVPVLIFANKQDLPNALTIDEIKEQMNLSKLDEMKVKWHIQPTVATQNKGINEGFQWLADTLKPKTDLTQPITETINDSKIMTDDLLSAWNSVNLKTLLSKFI